MSLMKPEHVIAELERVGARRVLVQAPQGLRGTAIQLSEELSRRGFDVVISGGPCWGGCDLALNEAVEVSADAIVHLGHTEFVKQSSIPTIYLECRYDHDVDVEQLVEKSIHVLRPAKNIGLGMTLQWLNLLERVKKALEDHGFSVFYGQQENGRLYPSQVIGCDYTAVKSVESKVEKFLIVGSFFHGLGLSMMTDRCVVVADPETMRVEDMTQIAKRVLMQRYAQICAFRGSKRVGVILCTKPGQKREGLATTIVSMLRKAGKDAYLLVLNEVDERFLPDEVFDAYVNTACPRISIDDNAKFKKPILLPSELMVALNLISWEELVSSGEYFRWCVKNG
ncbi:MAG: diphthamide biosynthesis enzyme Dph2 [Thaumarchaeota archaeon]|nr:diphthamide biosynthesis enzyme Dph2 [Candidatus Terraquivivens yellowstonensis]MCL7392876.1 diphthamide biosynthesis enzyme Dph2 [Candidatus Terraquivivens yellowstonensis]MCL7398092.1 diphthamide biosynthesis enzyme Dph2 [Candidatus Terraquivivens yellowstonensis]